MCEGEEGRGERYTHVCVREGGRVCVGTGVCGGGGHSEINCYPICTLIAGGLQ